MTTPVYVSYTALATLATHFDPKAMEEFQSFMKQHYQMNCEVPQATSIMDFYEKAWGQESRHRFINNLVSSPKFLEECLKHSTEFLLEVNRTFEKFSDFIMREIKGILQQCDNNLGALKPGVTAIVPITYDDLSILFDNELQIQGFMQSLIDTCAMTREELELCCPKYVDKNMRQPAPRRPGRR